MQIFDQKNRSVVILSPQGAKYPGRFVLPSRYPDAFWRPGVKASFLHALAQTEYVISII